MMTRVPRFTMCALLVAVAGATIVAQVAEPAASGVRFDLHWQWLAIRCLVRRSHLLQERVEGRVQCRMDMNLLIDVQR